MYEFRRLNYANIVSISQRFYFSGEGQGAGQGEGQGEGQGVGQGAGQGEGQGEGQGTGQGEGQHFLKRNGHDMAMSVHLRDTLQ